MRFNLVLTFIAIIIVLGGCQMPNENPSGQTKGEQEELKPADMNEEDLPDVRAFQDEFTREFLQSTEETRPGYYPFLSGTGAYRMDFPEEGKIGEKSYNIKDKSYEAIMISEGTEDSKITHNITIKYYDHLEQMHKDSRLGQIQSAVGENLDFEEIEKDNETYYISPFQYDKEPSKDDVYGYAALILNNNDLGGIRVVFTSYCEEDCDSLKDDDKQEAFEWIQSIKFVDGPKDSDKDEE